MNEKLNSLNPGDEVVFEGFSNPDDKPDNGNYLEVGEVYVVDSINEGEASDDEAYINVLVGNPDFDSKKRKTKNNPEHLKVDLFEDEFSLIDEDENENEGDEEEDPTSSTEVAYEDVKKGDSIAVLDEDGETISGEVIKKTKTQLVIDSIDEDGNVEEVTYKKSEIQTIYESDVSEEEPTEEKEEEEEKEKEKKTSRSSKKATSTKKTSAKKTTAKKTTKKGKDTSSAKAEVVDEDLKDLLILNEEEEDEEILELIKESDDICGLAEELAEESNLAEWKLAGVLYHVRKDKAFRSVNDGLYDVEGGFAIYTDAELGVHYRKAMDLIKIYTVFNRFGVSPDTLGTCGWAKSRKIVTVMDEKNVDKLVELASEQSLDELGDTIKDTYTKKGEDTREVVKKITFKFRLVEDAASLVRGYLEAAAEQMSLKKLDQVFDNIVTEWASEHLNVSKTTKARSRSASAKKSGK